MKLAVFIALALTALFVAVPSTGFARAGGKDYKWIINKLRAEGISPSAIQWSEIDALCMPLKAADAEEYNECRYEKAIIQQDFRDDAAQCDDAARAFNPNHLRYQAVVVDVPVTASAEAVTTLLNTTPAVADAKAFYRYLSDRCMLDRGWSNPRDYRRGRTR